MARPELVEEVSTLSQNPSSTSKAVRHPTTLPLDESLLETRCCCPSISPLRSRTLRDGVGSGGRESSAFRPMCQRLPRATFELLRAAVDFATWLPLVQPLPRAHPSRSAS